MDFNSAKAITGKTREKIRNSVKNKPIVPTKIPTSIYVGEYITQLEGR
jgi:hypothetical protein